MKAKSAANALLLLLAAAILLAGCKSLHVPAKSEQNPREKGEPAQETTVLRVLTNRVDLIENGVFDTYARDFAERHPGVSVKFEGITNYASDIMIRLSTRNMGDVLLLPNNLANESLPKYFEPLDDALFENAHFADFKAHGGKRYGIVTGTSTTGIVYNKKAFREAGIASTPITLDEFYDACEKLKAAGKVPIYLNYGAQWPLMSWGEDLVSFMTGNPDYLNEMTNTDEPWRLDNAWGEAIEIVRNLIKNGYVEQQLIPNQWETSKRELASGGAGMYLMGNWVINQIVAAGARLEEIGFFPFPYDNETNRYAPLSPDWFVGVSRFSANKELAAEWIEFFVNESDYVDASGFLPVRQGKQSSLPQIEEFMSFRPSLVEKSVPSDLLLEISNAAQIAFWSGDYIQEWIAAPDLGKVFGEYNARWAEARRLVVNDE
ncbi:extracellular solute-binding protein [Paenibacillus sp. LHD-117]|uniref:ABC transporter substrate-binding protein n=1 Tax=Paenibacillus sp. LHD-117 TaxID=3071412 RepID=UPI0027DF2EA7|nr:extracellular solute-binding protein [Paenibacillus sp. LHD-117]MDQ6421217.1 extracellular solute-binding protein [Paenibacillus sp. LHD-117]